MLIVFVFKQFLAASPTSTARASGLDTCLSIVLECVHNLHTLCKVNFISFGSIICALPFRCHQIRCDLRLFTAHVASGCGPCGRLFVVVALGSTIAEVFQCIPFVSISVVVHLFLDLFLNEFVFQCFPVNVSNLLPWQLCFLDVLKFLVIRLFMLLFFCTRGTCNLKVTLTSFTVMEIFFAQRKHIKSLKLSEQKISNNVFSENMFPNNNSRRKVTFISKKELKILRSFHL